MNAVPGRIVYDLDRRDAFLPVYVGLLWLSTLGMVVSLCAWGMTQITGRALHPFTCWKNRINSSCHRSEVPKPRALQKAGREHEGASWLGDSRGRGEQSVCLCKPSCANGVVSGPSCQCLPYRNVRLLFPYLWFLWRISLVSNMTLV